MMSMDFSDYVLRNEKLYGLIMVSLNMKSDYIPKLYEFTLWADTDEDLWFKFEGYGYYPDYVYLACHVAIGHKYKIDCFYKKASPSRNNIEIWSG